MDLNNSLWRKLEGGNGIPYDASRPLRKLENAATREEIKEAFTELWDNLHYHGNVGTASYLALTQLVRICINKRSLDWNFVGLCVLIENCRLNNTNPEIPDEFQDMYFDALLELEKYLLVNFKSITDKDAIRLTLALLATINGQPTLGRAIEILDEDRLAGFISGK